MAHSLCRKLLRARTGDCHVDRLAFLALVPLWRHTLLYRSISLVEGGWLLGPLGGVVLRRLQWPLLGGLPVRLVSAAPGCQPLVPPITPSNSLLRQAQTDTCFLP